MGNLLKCKSAVNLERKEYERSSIHITKHQFEKILSQLEVFNFPIDAFFVIARKEEIYRVVVVDKQVRTTKKVSSNFTTI